MCILLSRAIDAAFARHAFHLAAFVFMPDHAHLLAMPLAHNADVSALLFAIKRPHAFRVKRWMQENDPAKTRWLTVRERPGKTVFRFWQEGSGHDRDVVESEDLWSIVDYIHNNPVEARLCATAMDWQWSSWHWWERREQRADLPAMSPLPEGWA